MRTGVLLVGLVALCGCQRTTTSESSVKWSSRLVMPPGEIAIRCDTSTSARCLVRLDDGGRERTAALPVATERRFTGISPDARLCVVALADAACDWRPVKPAGVP